MFKGKTIVVGVCGGIAAYKACDVVSKLKKHGFDVHVIMTKSATEFVSPLTFRSLSNNFVVSDMFAEPKTWEIEHISLAKKADAFLIVPATANIIGKIASGIADDMLTTTVMATEAPVIFAPAMNTKMLLNPITQANIEKLRNLGYDFIESQEGLLACGDLGKGKLAQPEEIVDRVVDEFAKVGDLSGKRVMITAGPTIESIDPVRFISNRSTGKMGYAVAAEAIRRGAEVTLISGKTNLRPPKNLNKYISIQSAQDLYNAVMENFEDNDIIIQSAAVADYKPKKYSDKKIKKSDGDLSIALDRNRDIALELGKIKANKVLVGFAAESNDLIENASAKIKKKNLDFIVANDITAKGAGFAHDTNIVKIIDAKGSIDEFPIMTKSEVANVILDKIIELKK